MLNAIHAQEAQQSAREKAKVAVQKLKGMKLKEAAQKIEGSIKQTITHMPFLADNRLRIRTKNGIEHIMREIRRCTRVVGKFPDRNSSLMLACALLRHMTSSKWVKNAI